MLEKFNDLPLCRSPLSRDEAIRLECNMTPLMRFLGSPGDWGYQSKLGQLTKLLAELHGEVAKARNAAVD